MVSVSAFENGREMKTWGGTPAKRPRRVEAAKSIRATKLRPKQISGLRGITEPKRHWASGLRHRKTAFLKVRGTERPDGASAVIEVERIVEA